MTITLEKMKVQLSDPVTYQIQGLNNITLNECIGKTVTLKHTGDYHCIQCNRSVKKLFQQGYCYPCFRELQSCNLCIIHPERCLVMEGKCSHDHWAHKHCHANHIIYLSFTSNIKVGITQEKNVPSRWIDQGAVAAIPILKTSNRYLSGIVEVSLKQYFKDKTNWRTMLKESPDAPDLWAAWQDALIQAKPNIDKLIDTYGKDHIEYLRKSEQTVIHYPITDFPTKITSLSLEKTPIVSDRLIGIKGQYLYFSSGVMNIRKFSGFEIEFEQNP